MQQQRIRYLLQRKVSGMLSSEEWQELSAALQQESLSEWEDALLPDMLSTSPDTFIDTNRWAPILAKVMAIDKPATADLKPAAGTLSDTSLSTVSVYRIHFLKTTWFRYAVVVLLIAGTAAFLYRAYQKPQQEMLGQAQNDRKGVADIQPGGNKAILTLSDGSRIVLDSAANGNLAEQGNTKILKLDAGKLAYNAGSGGEVLLYNTISTPKGGQYQVTLPDGTNVWLNAASSIKFPTTFLKTERKVEISGEVYFEVAGDIRRPFKVMAGDRVKVDVLGTSFNINAYADENSISTTLAEGSVRVVLLSGENSSIADKILTAGQQGTIRSQAGKIIQERIDITPGVDLQKVLAWKNGLFYFTDADLTTVMRQLSRWYDLDLQYADGVELNEKITGEMKRDLSLNQVLEGLGELGVHFKLEGKRLIIMP